MANMIVIFIIAVIMYFAVKPIIQHRKQAKKGHVGCIGCSQAGNCSSNKCNI